MLPSSSNSTCEHEEGPARVAGSQECTNYTETTGVTQQNTACIACRTASEVYKQGVVRSTTVAHQRQVLKGDKGADERGSTVDTEVTLGVTKASIQESEAKTQACWAFLEEQKVDAS
jgi:hypothetical protein